MERVYSRANLRTLEAAVRRTVSAWSLSPNTRVELLNLSENATFLLTDHDRDRRLVVRVYRPGYRSEAEIRSELAWIGDLRSEGVVATPAPVPGANRGLLQPLDLPGPRWAVAFEHVVGRQPRLGADAAVAFRALGAITARLHAHARRWTQPRGFTRQAWDWRTMLGDASVWGDWRNGVGLDGRGRALLERTAECLRKRLAAFGTRGDRFGLIHADLRLANLLIDGEALEVIDFDDCGFGWFAYDFAAAVSFSEDDPLVPELLAAWLAGYREVAPFGAEAEALMPVFVMLRRLILLAWVASHAEVPEAQGRGRAFTAGTLALAEGFLRRYG